MTQPGGTVRTVKTKLEMDAGGFKRELVDGTAHVIRMTREIDRLGSIASQKAAEVARAAREQEQAMERQMAAADRLGKGMLVVGAGIATALGLAVRAAIQWESAWAGVAKTVDGSDAQLDALQENLREMARSLPATHEEIAAVAEAAGQLGVATGDIAAFTETMVALGESTNLTADEAATAIAQLMNVMGTAPDDVDNLAAALVELGNNGASTERQILMMAQRIAGAGSIVGASEADILALANALASVGIEVEAGGSAISGVMVKIASAVDSGSESLDGFAQVAGMSSDEFAAAWAADPVAALNSFVQGLGRMDAAGQSVFGTLSDLGLSEIRTRDALLRLSSAGDLLTDSLGDGARAWEENTALIEEAERRYGTVEARMQVARNQVNDLAIDIGQKFLPVVGAMADTLGTVADLFGALPGPVQAVLGTLAAVAAAVLLAGGAALVAVPKVAAFRAAMDQLAASGGRAATAVGAFRATTGATAGFLGGPWGVALALGVAAVGLFAHEQSKASRHAEELKDALNQQTGAVTENARLMVAQALAAEEFTFNAGTGRGVVLDFADALAMANVEMSTAVEAAAGNDAALRDLQMRLSEAEAAYRNGTDVTGQYAAGTEEAKQATLDYWNILKLIIGAITAEGTAVQIAGDEVRAMAAATGQATDDMAGLEPATRAAAESLGLTADEARDLTEEADALSDALDGLFGSLFGVEEAEDAAAEAMRRLVETAAEQGTALEGNSEAALDNRDNVRGLIQADMDLVTAMAEAGASAEDLQGATDDLRQKFIDQMRQAGFSEEAIREYAAAYDRIPSEVATHISTPGLTEAERRLRNLRIAVESIPKTWDVNVNVHQATTLPGTGGFNNIANRWGGVTYHAQSGLLRNAKIFSPVAPARFAFAEPATGGEAFVPRLGNRLRSLAIADVAARWHGGRVVAEDGAGIGGPWQWHGGTGSPAAVSATAAFAAEDRALLRGLADQVQALADRPIELRTTNEVIARSANDGQRVIARRR